MLEIKIKNEKEKRNELLKNFTKDISISTKNYEIQNCENQINNLNNKIEKLSEKNLQLSNELAEKDKLLEIEKEKSNELIISYEKKIEEAKKNVNVKNEFLKHQKLNHQRNQ